METAVAQAEERIAQDVARFDPAEAEIARIKNEYQGLAINGPEDKDGRKMVHAAWRDVRDTRLGAEKLHKDLTADALKYKQAVDARKRQVVEALKPMEDGLYEQWKGFDNAIENRKKEEAERAERERLERVEERKKSLYRLGMAFNGIGYVSGLEGVEGVSDAQVTGLNDGPFQYLLDGIANQVGKAREVEAKAKAEKEEADRLAKIEADRQASIAAENERKARELKEQEDRINKRIEDARTNELVALGAQSLEFPALPLAQYAEDRWPEEVRMVRVLVEKRKEDEAAAIAKAEEDRKAYEARIASQAAARERELMAAQEEQRKEAEAERIRRAGDAGAFEVMLHHLSDTPWPVELKSAIAQQTMEKVRVHIEASMSILKGTMEKDLK